MKGKLIVIEGLDGSGKSTQLERLPGLLAQRGIASKTISFPDYDDPSSTLVRMYLGGEFGGTVDAVNAYAASIFYAADRYASYKRHWGAYYEAGGLVLAGRYVSSNAVHQAAKLPREEWEGYLSWLYDLEYNKTAIPKPDLVLFLDMPPEVSQQLLAGRYAGDESKKDLHERDRVYQQHCREAALFAAAYSGWQVIPCAKEGQPLPPEEISAMLAEKIQAVLQRPPAEDTQEDRLRPDKEDMQ